MLDFLIDSGYFKCIRDTILSSSKRIEEKASVLLLALQRFNPDLPNILSINLLYFTISQKLIDFKLHPSEKTIASFLSTVFSCPGVVEVVTRKELEKDKHVFLVAALRVSGVAEHLDLQSNEYILIT